MISLSRQNWWLALVAVVLLALGLSACTTPNAPGPDKTLTLATVLPTTGVNAAIGAAMQRAVDLAARQNAALGNGYTLTVTHVDEASAPVDQVMTTLAADHHVMGIVGPFDSQSAATMLPGIEQNGIVTISPGATLPGLTQTNQATAEGLTFAQLHPQGKPVAFFRLPETDASAGKVAADLAVAPAASHGLAATSFFVVNDGTPSGKTLAAAFIQELKAKQGNVAGQQTLVAGAADGGQSVVTAIIEANPDAVFFAGDTAAGAELRQTLSLTGVPQVMLLTASPIANNPTWSTIVTPAAAAAFTTAILPAPDLSALPNAKDFSSAYQTAYSGETPLPQSALAYDAAMDEIAALKSLAKAGKTPTRALVLSTVAAAKYPGVTGTLAFDQNGDNTTPLGFSLYTSDTKGVWQYQTALTG